MKKLPMKLQYFADPDPEPNPVDPAPKPNDDTSVEETETDDDPKEPEVPEGYHSDDEVDEIVKRKFAKWKKQEQQKIEEAKKLEQMNTDEKTQYQLEQLRKENEELQTFKAKQDMVLQAQQMASDAQLKVTNTDLEHVVTAEAESTKQNFDWLNDFAKRVREDAKAEFLKGSAPTVGGKGMQDETNYGKRLAEMAHPQTKNPYFNSNKED